MKVDSRFKDKLYKNDDPIDAINTYKGILENYLLIHTQGTIGVFKHRKRNQDVIVWNVVKPYENGHSHFNTLQVAKIIANNVALQRKPKTNTCLRNLASYERIATNEYPYLEWVNDLMATKIDKKIGNNKHYYNVGKAV